MQVLRVAADPSLMLVSGPLDPTLNARVLLNYNDPHLGTDAAFIRDFLPEPKDASCKADTREKLQYSYDKAIEWIDVFSARTKAIANHEVKAGDMIANMTWENLVDKAARAVPEVNSPVPGYVMMGVGATLATGGAVAGLVSAPAMAGAAATVAADGAAPALTVIQGGAPAVAAAAEGTAVQLARAAAVATAVVGGTHAANAAPIQQAEASTLLPPLAQMNQGGDEMGERSHVDHISFRMTGYKPSDPRNTLEALAARDVDNGAQGPAAHALLKADGSFVRQEGSSRAWSDNPQIDAGKNGNAVGVYVEGTTALTQAQRQSLNELAQAMQAKLDQMGHGLASLSPAGMAAEQAWQGQTPSVGVQPFMVQPQIQRGGAPSQFVQ